MEIANTIMQKEKEAEPSSSATASSVQSEEDEINMLYKSVPQIADHFVITDKVGEGAFSTVYFARLKHYPEVCEQFALKHILPTTHPSRIENELRCLLKLGGSSNVMGVKTCLRNKDNVVIVMEYFPHDRFQDFLTIISVEEAREYMKNLLLALRRVHQFKVIHRDVKPSNFLYNRQTKKFSLVDFGLASGSFLIDRDGEKIDRRTHISPRGHPSHPIHPSPPFAFTRVPLSPSKANIPQNRRSGIGVPLPPGRKTASPSFCVPSGTPIYRGEKIHCACLGKPQICSLCVARRNQLAPRAGTAGFRSPEVLLKSPEQDTGVDIWSAGTIFLSLLSARYPFFKAQDDLGYLSQIISLLGSEACVEAAKSFGKVLTLSEPSPALDLRSTCLKLRSTQMTACFPIGQQLAELSHGWSNISDDAFDLLRKMLDPNPATRITAENALKHPFFSEPKSDANLCR